MLPDDRRELWLLGLGLGLCTDAALLLAAVNQGWPLTVQTLPHWAATAVSVTTLGLFGLPLFVALVRAGAAIVVALDQWAHRNDTPAEPPAPAALVDVAKEPDEYNAETEAWRVALDRFFRAGESAGGFSAGKLSGVAGSDSWPRLVHFYAGKAGGNILRDAGGNVGHTWGHGWTLDRVMLAIGTNRLPHPDMPLPVISPFVVSTAQRRAPQKSKAAPRVVENAAKAAE